LVLLLLTKGPDQALDKVDKVAVIHLEVGIHLVVVVETRLLAEAGSEEAVDLVQSSILKICLEDLPVEERGGQVVEGIRSRRKKFLLGTTSA
jgi:hypothetical protein